MAISKSEITQASVARGIDKQTHEVFYVVKSDSQANTWYEVRWNDAQMQWCCNCPATCSGCKHNRAVQEVLKARRAAMAIANKPAQPRREYAALNGNHSFTFNENGVPMR